jgi:hypothetical protein
MQEPVHLKISCNSKWLQMMIALFVVVLLFAACSADDKQIPPPQIFIAQEEPEIEVTIGDTIKLEPKITYNIGATYQWKKNNELLNHQEQFLQDTASQLGNIEYVFKVTTPYGNDSLMISVDVIILADFENLISQEKKDSAWIGSPDSTGFAHNTLFFPNHLINDTTWKGFAFSNRHSRSTTPPIDPTRVYAPLTTKNTFALVRYPNEKDDFIPTITFPDGKNHNLKSIEVTNSTKGHFLMKFGDSNFERMGGPQGTNPDWCKVTITGINADGTITGEKDFFLSDFRFDNNKRNYIIDDWSEVNLRKLGAVNKIQFTISTNKTNSEGEIITPEIFCIDNVKIID